MSPGGTATVEFDCRFDTPGDHAVEVRAPGDALDVDNHRFLVVRCGRRCGPCASTAGRRACRSTAPPTIWPWRFGRKATAIRPAGGLIRAEVAAESALAERSLADYDCVFLCNVAQFTADEARVLDAYLQSGGNLVFFLGDQVSADHYNRELGVGEGRGKGSRADRDSPVRAASRSFSLPGWHVVDQPQDRLDPLGYRHPILQAFRGRGKTGLLTTPVFKHFRLVLPRDSPAKIVLALADGDPLIVEQSIHRGTVTLVATSADPSWTALPLWPSFVPLVHEIAAWGVAARQGRRNVTVGEPLEAWFSASAAAASGQQSSRPTATFIPCTLRADGDYAVLDYANTSQSGIYAANFGPSGQHAAMFAVNVDTAESDLAQVEPEELQNEVWQGVHFTRWDRAARPGAATAAGTSRPRRQLHGQTALRCTGAAVDSRRSLGWKLGSSLP